MNLVSVLIAPAIVSLTVGAHANGAIRYGIAIIAVVIIVAAVAVSKSRSISFGDDDSAPDLPDESEAVAVPTSADRPE